MKKNLHKTYSVYGLYEEGSDSVRYIGYTKHIDLNIRLKQHFFESKKTHKGRWLQKTLKNNVKVEIRPIESNLSYEEAVNKEIFYIAHFKSIGANLTNLNEGGLGSKGYKVTEEIKLRLKKHQSGKSNHFYGRTHTETSINKMRVAQKGQKNGFYGKKHSKETKAKLKEASKKQIRVKGWHHSEGTKHKISIKNKNLSVPLEVRQQISTKLKGRVFSDEHKAKLKLAWDKRKNKIEI